MPENWNAYEQGPNLGLLFYRRIYRQKEVLDKLRFKESEDGDCLEFDVTNEDPSHAGGASPILLKVTWN